MGLVLGSWPVSMDRQNTSLMYVNEDFSIGSYERLYPGFKYTILKRK